MVTWRTMLASLPLLLLLAVASQGDHFPQYEPSPFEGLAGSSAASLSGSHRFKRASEFTEGRKGGTKRGPRPHRLTSADTLHDIPGRVDVDTDYSPGRMVLPDVVEAESLPFIPGFGGDTGPTKTRKTNRVTAVEDPGRGPTKLSSYAVCNPPCQNLGICLAPNKCHCPEGWTGKRCEVPKVSSPDKCGDIPPPPMNSRIYCTGEECTAQCKQGYQLDHNTSSLAYKCDRGSWVITNPVFTGITPDCHPICDPACQNAGRCIAPDQCLCTQEYRGDICQYHVSNCDPKSLNFNGKINCSGRGMEFACVLTCVKGGQFTSPPAEKYTCNYTSSTWSPLPIPKCDYSSLDTNFTTKIYTGLNITSVPVPRKPGICFTWAGAHYRTFDNKIYSFKSGCQYTLVKDSAHGTFTVNLHNADGCEGSSCRKVIQIFLDDEEYVLQASESGQPSLAYRNTNLAIPGQMNGVVSERVAHFVVVKVSGLGLTIKWDMKDQVETDISELLWNKTSGLCGRHDGNMDNDWSYVDGVTETDINSFLQVWQANYLGELCYEQPRTRHPCDTQNDEGNEFCSLLLHDERFALCRQVVDVEPYINACRWDYCDCDSHDRESCACESFAAFYKECTSVGVDIPGGWRSHDLCPVECKAGKVYNPCMPAIQPRCGQPAEGVRPAFCVEGCDCPQGLVMHHGFCIPASDCPCTHHNEDYSAGVTIAKDCNSCTCVGGEWECTEVKCGSRCAAVGDPHYSTFDGRRFDFMGKCSYYLVQGQDFSIEAENTPCAGAISEAMNFPDSVKSQYPSCTKSVTIRLQRTVIHLKQGREVTVNGVELRALPAWVNGAYIKDASSIFIIVELTNGLDVWWDGQTRVYIDAPAEFRGQTAGLCGTFTDNQRDDFLTPEGDIEQNVVAFANKWKTSEKCPDQPLHPETRPCDRHVQSKAEAEKYCAKLKSDLFSDCHLEVDPEPFYHDCLYDMCSCETNMDHCFCPVVSAFGKECARRGILVDWRAEIRECEIQCTAGQKYQVCGNSCSRSCTDLATNTECTKKCVEGCNCEEGFTLDSDGVCVPITECPCVHDAKEYKPGYEMLQQQVDGSNLKCECRNAVWKCWEPRRNDTKNENVVSECREHEHEVHSDCLPQEQQTCQTVHLRPIPSESCRPGCACAAGYVRDTTRGVCVSREECPCHHGGLSYRNGASIIEDCNTCICEGGQWLCTERQCPGICTAWGDSHYKTFDGRLYEFHGTCDYLLAKGKASRADTFDVIVQSVPCGTSGVTCTKSITLRVGTGNDQDIIEFAHNKPTPSQNRTRTIIREAGVYIFAEVADMGLVLQWDRGTRVYLRLNPNWRGKVRGLCGNYNGDELDDFQTPSGGSSEASANIFGDSWRLQNDCPTSILVKDSCNLHPHRKVWATDQCAILRTEIFAPCHPEVPVEPYEERCLFDACACDTGGDCHCLCTAVAVYAHECNLHGVHIKWRTPDFCPMQCDEQCEHYEPCISTCPYLTCDTFSGPKSKLCAQETCVEGCSKDGCPPGEVYKSFTEPQCIPVSECVCKVIDGRVYKEGDILEQDDCHICFCSRKRKVCRGLPCRTTTFSSTISIATTTPTTTPEERDCRSGWSGWFNEDKPIISKKNSDSEMVPEMIKKGKGDQGFCRHAQMVGIKCRSVGTHRPHTQQQGVRCSLEEGLLCQGRNDATEADACWDYEVAFLCDCGATPTPTTLSTMKSSTPSPCIDGWTPWMNTHTPNPGNWDDMDDLHSLAEKYTFCAPHQIIDTECQAVGKGLSPEALGQVGVTCNSNTGLQCKNDLQARDHCADYEIRFYCDCSQVTTPVMTTTPVLPPEFCSSQSPLFKKHELDCYKFYECSNTSLTEMMYVARDCGPGKMFNTITFKCDSKYNVMGVRPECRECQPGYKYERKAIRCDRICVYYRYTLQQNGICLFDGEYAPACVDKRTGIVCPGNMYLRDKESCVAIQNCNCNLPNGISIPPGQVFHVTECKVCQCNNNNLECDSSACSTTTSSTATTTGKPIFKCDEWSPWLSESTPSFDSELELLQDLRKMYPELCSRPDDIECRVRGSHESPEEAGQVVMCNPQEGFKCLQSENAQRCLDYEVRFLCECETGKNETEFTETTTETVTVPTITPTEVIPSCPPPTREDSCAMPCNRICQYHLLHLKQNGECKEEDACAPGCVNMIKDETKTKTNITMCEDGLFMLSDSKCVPKAVCTCQDDAGRPIKPGEWFNIEPCKRCTCENNDLWCETPEHCKTVPPETTTEYPSSTCNDWSSYFSAKEENSKGVTLTLDLIRRHNKFGCENPVNATCREVTTKRPAADFQQNLTCNANEGLKCLNENNDNVCLNYEISFFCACEETTPTFAPTTTLGPTTTQVPCEAWSPWINDISPMKFDGDLEYKSIQQLQKEYNFCQVGHLANIECVATKTGLSAAGDKGIICDVQKGFLCRNKDQDRGRCHDYKIRYYCSCEKITTTTIIIPGSSTTPPPLCDPNKYIKLLEDVEDEAFSSTPARSALYGPASGRLYHSDGSLTGRSWASLVSDKDQFIQVDLGSVVPVYGVEVAGNPLTNERVTAFNVQVSRDNNIWSVLLSDPTNPSSQAKIFRGPLAASEPLEQIFSEPVEARYLRVKPTDWYQAIALRFEVIGCGGPTPITPSVPSSPKPECVDEMGLENEEMSLSQITVSSVLKNDHSFYGKQHIPLNTEAIPSVSAGAWVAEPKPDQFVRFDFQEPSMLSGLIIQGRNNKDEWVETFTVRYSPDGQTWNVIKNPDGSDKVFIGNYDRSTAVDIMFDRLIQARFLEIKPKTWKNNIAMRVEILGCFHPYSTVSSTTAETTTEQPPPPHCSPCPGLPLHSYDNCVRCGNGQYFDGHTCVKEVLCPCFVDGIRYDIGTVFATAECKECNCLVGGDIKCNIKECPTCKDNQQSVLTPLCDCKCETCPEGTKLCPSSNYCLNESSWCNGIEECPDDEDGCTTTSQALESTTTSALWSTLESTTTPAHCEVWSPWINDISPMKYEGDLEYKSIQQLQTVYNFCQEGHLADIECVEVETSLSATGDKGTICDVQKGFLCRNKDQDRGRCHDYKIRYYCSCGCPTPSCPEGWVKEERPADGPCPIITCHPQETTSPLPCPVPTCPPNYTITLLPEKVGDDCPKFECTPVKPPECPRNCPNGYTIQDMEYIDTGSKGKCDPYKCVPRIPPPCPPVNCPPGYDPRVSTPVPGLCPPFDCVPVIPTTTPIPTTVCPPVECPPHMRILYRNDSESSPCPRFTCIPVTPCPPVDQPICILNEELYLTNPGDPCPVYACKPAPPTTPPPGARNITDCVLEGRIINTFDDSTYEVEICNHILAQDKVKNDWVVSVHHNCSSGKCYRHLTITQNKKQLMVQQDLHVVWNGNTYTGTEVQHIGTSTNTFNISIISDHIIKMESRLYKFTVQWNADMDIIVVETDLVYKVDGLCGYYSYDPSDDKKKPDGTLATSITEFAQSWAIDNDTCEEKMCSSEDTKTAFELCRRVQFKPFTECHSTINPMLFLKGCTDTMCDCLSGGADEEECRCQALKRYVTHCLEKNPEASIADWRVVAKCYEDCPRGETYLDCFRGTCEKSCETLHAQTTCQEESRSCVPGCFCNPGLVRKGKRCVHPEQCRDCICEGYGDPHYATFDRYSYTFNGECSYIAARDKSPEGHHKFQVITHNKKCTTQPVTLCSDSITILFNTHTVVISAVGKDAVRVNVDGNEVISYPHRSSWLALEQPDYSQVMAAISEIQLEVKYYLENFGFSIRLPSYLYFNKTEGLCGDCNFNHEDDLLAESKGLLESVDAFGRSWLLESEPNTCSILKKQQCFPLPPHEDPCLYILNEDLFGKCHAVEDPAPYVSSCQLDICNNADPREPACHSLEAYARRCAELDICLDWRSEELCPKNCTGGQEYHTCAPGCVPTCENFMELENNTDACPISSVDGCFCPNGMVLYEGTCVDKSYCYTCDEEGHHVGDTWQKDACTTCECTKKGSICDVKICPNPGCDDGFEPIEIPGTEDDCCGLKKKCKRVPPKNCTDPVKPEGNCTYGQNWKIITELDKCPRYACECLEPEECPSLQKPKDEALEPGEGMVLDNSGCCPRYVIRCTGQCPTVTCPEFHLLIEEELQEDECCPQQCVPPKDACIYNHQYLVDSKGFQQPVNTSLVPMKKLYQVGESWEDGLCLTCKCSVDSEELSHSQCTQQTCPALKDHPERGEYKLESVEAPGQCCPTVVRTACIVDGDVIKIGETRRDPVDRCQLVKCDSTPNGSVYKRVMSPTCDNTSCPAGWEYDPSPHDPQQCCGQCVQVACVVEGQVKAVGETWVSDDMCTSFTCHRDTKDQIQIQAVEVQCTKPSEKELEQYIFEEKRLPDQCCSVYLRVACLLNGTSISIGETLQDPRDTCVTISCESGPDGNIVRSEREKTCDRQCDLGSDYREPSFSSDDCCGKCIQTHCVDDGKLYSIGQRWEREEDLCHDYSCERQNDFLIPLATKKECPYFDPECPEESVYMDDLGCCKLCRITPEKEYCKPEVIPLEETVGLFEISLPRIGTCKNPNAVPNFKRCSGYCNSFTEYQGQGRQATHVSTCFCCKPSRFDKIQVELLCDKGDLVTSNVDNIVACECLECNDNPPDRKTAKNVKQ